MASEFHVNDVAAHPAVAAGFGAFVSLILARKMTTAQALLAWVAGFGCAMYISPIVVGHFQSLAAYERGVTFTVGVFGLQLAAIAYDVLIIVRENPRASLAALFDALMKRGASK